jgi:hypothetical protein
MRYADRAAAPPFSSAPVAPGTLLKASEVAARLRVPVSWVRKHGAELPGVVRLGKYIRWNSAKLDQFIAAGGLG